MGALSRLYLTSPVARRASRWGRQIPRALRRLAVRAEDYATSPPIVANSVPKSGTHLLTQILRPLASHDFGTFWTSVPSRPYREVPQRRMRRAVARIVPGEMVSAHLFFDPAYATELDRKHAVHVFVYRDPRDIVVSEAAYLTRINTWHALYPRFRALASDDDRISLAIQGGGPDFGATYPDVGQRFRRYLGWLRHDGVLAVRFEDLVGERRQDTVREIVRFHARRTDAVQDEDARVTAALASIDPRRSFTYRRGRAGGWRDAFTEVHKKQMKAVAGQLLIELGYESSLTW